MSLRIRNWLRNLALIVQSQLLGKSIDLIEQTQMFFFTFFAQNDVFCLHLALTIHTHHDTATQWSNLCQFLTGGSCFGFAADAAAFSTIHPSHGWVDGERHHVLLFSGQLIFSQRAWLVIHSRLESGNAWCCIILALCVSDTSSLCGDVGCVYLYSCRSRVPEPQEEAAK